MQIVSHKIALNPNNRQSTYFAKACGVARVAYNWGLAKWNEMYQLGDKPSESAIRKNLNAIKKQQFPWMYEVTKCAVQLAIKDDLNNAFKKFFNQEAAYPKFKKKGLKDSFHISNDQFSVKDQHIRIPNLGWVRMRESLRFMGKILTATISRVANKWFVSITLEVNDLNYPSSENQVTAGVDLGIKTFAVLSSNNQITNYASINPHKNLLTTLKKLNKSLHRKEKGSKNRKKARIELAQLHARISNVRVDYIEKTTTSIANKHSHVAVENLNLRGMVKNRKLARSILDMGFYSFRNRLETKLKARNKTFILADRWFASSKICSSCSYKNQSLTLKDRMWVCPNCNVRHDRDENAARNLEKLAVSSTVSVCGVSSNGGMLVC